MIDNEVTYKVTEFPAQQPPRTRMFNPNQSTQEGIVRLDNQRNYEGSNAENEFKDREQGSMGSGMATNQDAENHGTLMTMSCKTSNMVRDDQAENS